jgi:hypothetical protein
MSHTDTSQATALRRQLQSLTCAPGLSFAKDIAPLFNQTDIDHMKSVTSGSLDLSDYTSTKTWAHIIYSKLASHQMPPPPQQPFSDAQVNTFGCWIQQGCQP